MLQLSYKPLAPGMIPGEESNQNFNQATPVMADSESQIIAQIQSGNMDQFVILYDRYIDKIYKFIFFRTLHREHAEDLTSQVFIRAMDKISTFKPDKGTFQAWLYQIARNIMIDEFRKQKPTDNIDEHENLPSNENIENEVDKGINAQRLKKLLQQLPDESQELVTMRLWNELSYAEISSITGKTEGSLKMQFSRIIDKLQASAHLLILVLLLTRW